MKGMVKDKSSTCMMDSENGEIESWSGSSVD